MGRTGEGNKIGSVMAEEQEAIGLLLCPHQQEQEATLEAAAGPFPTTGLLSGRPSSQEVYLYVWMSWA